MTSISNRWNHSYCSIPTAIILAQAMSLSPGLEQLPLPCLLPVLKSSHELSTQQPERHFEVQACPCHCFALHIPGHLSVVGEVQSSYCSHQTWHVLASAYLFISLLLSVSGLLPFLEWHQVPSHFGWVHTLQVGLANSYQPLNVTFSGGYPCPPLVSFLPQATPSRLHKVFLLQCLGCLSFSFVTVNTAMCTCTCV